MAGRVTNSVRDELMTQFREAVCDRMGVAPFLHQREVWAAGDGEVVLGELPGALNGHPGRPTRTVNVAGNIVHYEVAPRLGGRAHILADLGAFKIGKSYGVALWASGFAAVPGARVSLVGLEYDICEPEFTYLCEFLLSDMGMGIKADSLQNRPRDGKMWMDLPNGARYEARSWERKDSLKGKEIDAYIYCEAYQLPGIECFTGFSQNLRARQGYAYFPTTPDRPWVKALHERGHGAESDWHCTCSIGAEVNPFTFDQKAKDRDVTLMTKETFAIHYEGKIGDFIGRVYPYQQGERTFTQESHPHLFPSGQFRVPSGWDVVGGADTGTHYSAVLVMFDPDGFAYVIDEFPNYEYIGQKPDRDPAITIPGWAKNVWRALSQSGSRGILWADPNSQFKGELLNYGLTVMPQRVPVETRTEITREYFQHNKILLAPWLRILPFEIENAEWPAEASQTGAYKRVKDRDHTLDCLEHVLARRPYGKPLANVSSMSWAESQGWRKMQKSGNVHLGNGGLT